MPAIASSHLYTFLAMTTVSIILISSFSLYASGIRSIPEAKQLENILDHVASKANELLTLVATTNSTVRSIIQLPSEIGYQNYWIRVLNDESNVWVEGALGQMGENRAIYRVFLPSPRETSTSGYYRGGYGVAILECYMQGLILHLNFDSALGG